MAETPIRTLKSLGQHFLVDKGIVRRIADAAAVGPDDTVLEVGPGRAILSNALLEKGAKVVAVELDRGLHTELAERFADEPRLTLHHRDALKFPLDTLPTSYKVVANLPYQVTTPLLFHFLEASPAPAVIVVMIQHEVAQRILAKPGTKEYGVLTLGVTVRATAEMCFTVPAGAFRPPPKVKSAVVRITPRAEPLMPPAGIARFMEGGRAGRGQRRKTLRNALGSLRTDSATIDAACARAGVDPMVRGEKLDLEAYMRLTRALFPDA